MFPIEKPLRIRSRKHLEFVASKPCIVCKSFPVQAHHLTIAQPKARGLRAGDQYAINICFKHHNELHMMGNERKFWEKYGINAIEATELLWAASEANHDS